MQSVYKDTLFPRLFCTFVYFSNILFVFILFKEYYLSKSSEGGVLSL